MTILESLQSFDQVSKKGFYPHEIIYALSSVDAEEKQKPEYAYEELAFSLQPYQDGNPWGFYYGPQFTFADKNGDPIYSPSLDEVTPDAIAYWNKRVGESINPLFKARYAGLVWDFENRICKKGHVPTLRRNYVDSMLKVCNEDYLPHPTITANLLERLFEVTKSQQDDLEKTKQAYKDFEARHATDDAVRYWASRFLMMLEYKKAFTSEEQKEIVAEHEARLVRLSTPKANGHVDPWTIQKQADLLAQYYNSLQQKEEVKRVLKIEENSFKHETKSMSSLQLMGNLNLVHKAYIHYGLREDAVRLSIDLQKLGEKTKDEFQTFSHTIDIPQAVIDQADIMFGDKAGSEDERWKNFAVYFIPRKSDEEEELKKLVQRFPLNYMAQVQLTDDKGHPMSVVDPYESDPNGQLILHITQKLNIQSHFLYMAINRLMTTQTLTVDKAMNKLIIPCPLFEEDRYDIIKQALVAFVNGNYILFSHLIVPQIEHAIFKLAEFSGCAILKPQGNGKGGGKGFQLRILDDLLREDVMSKVFTEDGSYYLRLVLTEQRALNIRNGLCHGIFPPDYFGGSAACRLFHVLVLIGLVRPI